MLKKCLSYGKGTDKQQAGSLIKSVPACVFICRFLYAVAKESENGDPTLYNC